MKAQQDVWKVKQDYGRMCGKAGTSHARELRNFAKEPSDPLRYFTLSLPFYESDSKIRSGT